METTVIEYYGAPGSGKTQNASLLVGSMLMNGKDAAYVSEFATELAYDEYDIGPLDQVWICAEQLHREVRLYGKTDYIITDSPIPLGSYYEELYYGTRITREMVQRFRKHTERLVRRIPIWLDYKMPVYQEITEGRYHNIMDSQRIDGQLKLWCEEIGVRFNNNSLAIIDELMDV